MTRYDNAWKALGNTPLVGLPKLSPRWESLGSGKPTVRLWAKLEDRNPTGSIKDRTAASMMSQAIESGQLKPGCTIIEASSGNTGISLAVMSRTWGYDFVCVIPEDSSEARKAILRKLEVEIVYCPSGGGSNAAVLLARQLAKVNPDWVHLDQYSNLANADAHYHGTAPELLSDLPTITHFVAGLGTTGTLMGVGKYLQSHLKKIEIIGVEPCTGTRVPGLRDLSLGYVPEIYDATLLTRRVSVTLADAQRQADRLLTAEGIFAGPSTGANLHAAIDVSRQSMIINEEADIAFPVNDSGWRYLD